ncbi:MAG TPA: hypothetical protein VMF64_07820 [Steroidobacteraceae bacterium]|nr:hypothetical protein [Steroidobacteraceae bacterium]
MTAIRRPVLKIVEPSSSTPTELGARRVQHDARGNAIWSEPISLEDTGDLVLQTDAHSQPPGESEGDPYNRGPRTRQPR